MIWIKWVTWLPLVMENNDYHDCSIISYFIRFILWSLWKEFKKERTGENKENNLWKLTSWTLLPVDCLNVKFDSFPIFVALLTKYIIILHHSHPTCASFISSYFAELRNAIAHWFAGLLIPNFHAFIFNRRFLLPALADGHAVLLFYLNKYYVCLLCFLVLMVIWWSINSFDKTKIRRGK